MLLFSFLDYGGVKDTPFKPEHYLSYSDSTISFKRVNPVVLQTITNTGRIKTNKTLNVLLLRCFIHIAYLRNNNMFRPFLAIIRLIIYSFRGNHTISNIKPFVPNEISFPSIKFSFSFLNINSRIKLF